jgi:hypothetical protein
VTPSPFRTRTVVVLVAGSLVSLLAGFFWSVFGPEISLPPQAATDAYSRSAVGHRALVESLRDLGVPVETSRTRTMAKARRASLVVVAEPDPDLSDTALTELRAILDSTAPVLLVLPKWAPSADPFGRVAHVTWKDEEMVLDVLHEASADLSIARPSSAPAPWSTLDLDGTPSLSRPQLLKRPRLPAFEPLVTAANGDVLAGVLHREGDLRDVTIVADPDLVENHGLHQGDNAVLAVSLVTRAREGGGPVVVDETLHGHAYVPSVFRSLFRWPLALATLQAFLAAVVWVWAGIGRFGAPSPPAVATERATRDLVARTADLLHRGRHGAHVLARYLASAVHDVARTTQAPAGLSGPALDEWMLGLEAARRPSKTLASLRARVGEARAAGPRDARKLVATASAIHAWRREMTHGAVGGS